MLKTTESVVKVRRLSTVSSVVAAAGHLFCTRWEWFWKDENNKWQSYDTPGDGHVVNTTSSECLERDYQAGKDTHPFGASHHQYTLNFKRWCQKNDKFKTERPVRRRPAEFVSKQNMTDIIAQRRKAAGMARPTGASSTETNGVPSHWSSIPFGAEYSCESLSSISVEYKNTEKRFQDSMDKSHKIVSIQRVQNPDLWIQYKQKKDRMAKKSGKEPEERQLFHGTNPSTVEAICQQGFDWRMCGKNATFYGKGSYFASNANYSHCYSKHGVSRGNKQMFLAKVLVGSFTNGDKSFTRPPPKDSSNPHVLYDSCCNDTTNPALFVVFENGQSYPEFLITYT